MTCISRMLLSAVISRIIFTAHGVLLVWRVVDVKKDQHYWLLLIGLALVYVEMTVTLTHTRKGEWKWFSPMVFLYLCTAIPSIFLLELDLLQVRILLSNSSISAEDLAEMNIPKSSQWLEGLEQIMILVLVIGRWLMPKGEMNRDQLSQLLLVYIGLGADIIDILQIFKEPTVATDCNITIVGLALFSWALLQFTMVLTQTESSESLKKIADPDSQSSADIFHPDKHESGDSSWCTNDVWSLIITVGMQDGPFLIYRLYLMIKKGVQNEMMIFFACKNMLTVMIEIYRIAVVQCARNHHRNK
ncbi:transmembrane protein 26-like [Ascaphus truei]|uniref:transmembrane protein 26-like n=1 Tax=Ascaphus truei TaxID=8439 RepID=UPI003F5954A1